MADEAKTLAAQATPIVFWQLLAQLLMSAINLPQKSEMGSPRGSTQVFDGDTPSSGTSASIPAYFSIARHFDLVGLADVKIMLQICNSAAEFAPGVPCHIGSVCAHHPLRNAP